MNSIYYTIYSILHILHNILYIIYNILCIMYNILCIMYNILCIIYNILYIVYCQIKAIKNFHIHKKNSYKKTQQRISKRHLSIVRDKQG
jgi:predicted membrane protein